MLEVWLSITATTPMERSSCRTWRLQPYISLQENNGTRTLACTITVPDTLMLIWVDSGVQILSRVLKPTRSRFTDTSIAADNPVNRIDRVERKSSERHSDDGNNYDAGEHHNHELGQSQHWNTLGGKSVVPDAIFLNLGGGDQRVGTRRSQRDAYTTLSQKSLYALGSFEAGLAPISIFKKQGDGDTSQVLDLHSTLKDQVTFRMGIYSDVACGNG